MCGIAGVYCFDGIADGFMEPMVSALKALGKRGPEVDGTYLSKDVLLGHTRLSILDVSDAANQPFTDTTGMYTLVFNGEIYNFRQLRETLRHEGIAFSTSGDTEVLIYWLISRGPEGIKDLQGFFAFALYNKHNGSLLLARDRYGIKPLLYHNDEHRLVFASEMKALFPLGIPKVFDRSSLQMYFQLNYIPGPWSVFENVLKLPPGHYMQVFGNTMQERCYYQIPTEPLPEYQYISYNKAMETLRDKLETAVVKRLVSDVPLGAFLSGGIDSSVIVALAARHVDKLSTFSIGFSDEPMFDETRYARSVAKMHGTQHTEFILTTRDLLSCMNDVLAYTDEPFADSSALAVYILSRETRSKVTVALSGDGADEMFAGYNKHMAHFRALSGGWDTRVIRGLHPLLGQLPQSRGSFLGNKIRQLHRFGAGMKLSDRQRYWRWAAFSDEAYPMELLLQTPDPDEYIHRKSLLTQPLQHEGGINQILLNDMQLVLTNDMLTKVDMMSMANSLEVRVPFLDHDLVNFVSSLPSSFKIDKTGRKKILRDTFRSDLPAELYHRPKQGFEVPLLSWFRRELKETILSEWLNDQFIRDQGLFNPLVINNLRKTLFSANPGEIHAKIWAIGVFQHWYRKYIDQK